MAPKKVLSSSEKLLTETELEFMSLIWRMGEASVHDILAALPAERKLAYTSVSTILRILEAKKVLQSRRQEEGRGHVYTPLVDKESYEAKTVQHMLTRVFDGTPVALVRHLLQATDLSATEINEIKELLDKGGKS